MVCPLFRCYTLCGNKSLQCVVDYVILSSQNHCFTHITCSYYNATHGQMIKHARRVTKIKMNILVSAHISYIEWLGAPLEIECEALSSGRSSE